MSQKIKIAHSPDTDDIFMFYALKTGKISHPDFEFDIVGKDIEELNQLAQKEIYNITAISMHAYAHLHEKYALLSSGASMAENDYGPILVAKEPFDLAKLSQKRIAVPGEWTTAFLLLKFLEPNLNYRVIPPLQILTAIQSGEVDAGLLIHEGQIQYAGEGFVVLHKIIDTWKNLAGNLPLPLGGNAIKKSLGFEKMQMLSQLQKESILYGLNHYEDARSYCMQVNPVLNEKDMDRYLSWYVNQRTVELGHDEQKALHILFQEAQKRNLISPLSTIEIV